MPTFFYIAFWLKTDLPGLSLFKQNWVFILLFYHLWSRGFLSIYHFIVTLYIIAQETKNSSAVLHRFSFGRGGGWHSKLAIAIYK